MAPRDFALGPPPERIEEILGRLNGEKHLITGNNDGPATLAASGWPSVQAYAEITVEDRPLVLCHYAFRTWNGSGAWFTQSARAFARRPRADPKQYDVGVDPMGFQPVDLPTILVSRRRTAPQSRPGK